MTVWLVGACPKEARQPPLRPSRAAGKSSAADRLREMLGMTVDEYEAAFERANILGNPPWESRRARIAGRRVRESITEPAVVLGRDAWLAMGLPSTAMYFETVENFTLVPHPSGKNLIYNDASMRAKLKETIDDLVGDPCKNGVCMRTKERIDDWSDAAAGAKGRCGGCPGLEWMRKKRAS